MEAILQRSKSKKHRTESKQSVNIELDPVKDELNCDELLKILDEEKSKVHSEEQISSSETKIKPPTIATQDLSTRKLENCTESIDKNSKLDSVSSGQDKINEICDNVNPAKTDKIPEVNLVNTVTSDISLKQSNLSSTDVASSDLKVPKLCEGTKLPLPLHMYPDIRSLKLCKEIHNIVTSLTLVKTCTETYKNKIIIEANKSFEEFSKMIEGLDKEPLMDMVHEYERAKKASGHLNSQLKYLKSNLKRKKDSLWKSIKKEACAKGKCDDGYSVTVKHMFNIKELDQDMFNEVKKILKEMEDLLIWHAFYAYCEEVTRLRIDHYIYELIENENSEEFQGSFYSEISEKKPISKLKKCISVMFDSQRQNVQDKQYLNICQKWLKILVGKLMENGKFEDNLFILNHVIRCPNGINDWAAALVQIPINKSETLELCAEQILLALFMILNPIPFKEFFLKNIKDSSVASDSVEAKFTVLDSEGEEEEIFEMSKKWSDADVVSLLSQIPLRSLYKHLLLENRLENSVFLGESDPQKKMLKLFAYSTAVIDVLFNGLETYNSENFPTLFENITNLVRHILLYISEYWTHYVNVNNHFKSEIQAVYDKLVFHVVFKIYNIQKLHTWRVLSVMPYNHISQKMFWNIMWIFFSPGKPEEKLYSEKDVQMKIKDESVLSMLLNHIKDVPVHDIFQLLHTIEKMILSSNNDKDFIKFAYCVIFKVSILETSLKERLCNEGVIILSSISGKYPFLVSVLLKLIDKSDVSIVQPCINLFKKINISNYIPEENDIHIISSWLLSDLKCDRNWLARLILKNMNWDFNEEGSLFLPYDLHVQIAVTITEAYVKFDANNSNEGLISKGVKQMLQFTSIGSQREEEEFVHWAWNILFCLRLHPLDRKFPPYVEVYDGYVESENKPDFTSDLFQPVLTTYENKHPSGCYLMLLLSDEGYSMRNLLKRGLNCFSSLVQCEQYMAAINSLYYILPFFVKNSEELLEKFSFIKAMNNLITADLTVMSNITGEPVIGAVLHKVAAIIKYQINQAGEHTIECAAPLIKLWIKILMKMLSPPDNSSANTLKTSSKQVHFLLDVLVKISFLHDYTRDCTLDLLSSYCSPFILPKSPQPSFWNRIWNYDSSVYVILNRKIIPEYPWLAWYVLLSEMKEKRYQDVWLKVQTELMKINDGSPATCLKKISYSEKIDLEYLPIYRWALQAVETPVSHPASPLIWQQFFLYYFHRIPLPNSENCASIGMKYFTNGQFVALLKKIKKCLGDTEEFYRHSVKNLESEYIEASDGSKNDKYENKKLFFTNLKKLFQAFRLWIENESLHDSGLCLSALEPKYCPYRLELILNRNENIWFDMVSINSLKDEIDQKIHSWECFKKIPKEIIQLSTENEESLPEKIVRHIENYESILTVVSIKPTSVVACRKNGAFTSKETVIEMIEQNQSIIFEKAQYFCDVMTKLKQLNFNFINWTPQEYEIEDCEITELKVCHKGDSKCAGPAYFRLQIQKCKKNERISQKIENNRAEFFIVEDQLSKLPVKDLCISSLHIENCIRSLANKAKQVGNADAEYYRKMGIALFYHQIGTIDKIIASVADYRPSRQFFSLIIESVGREFIDGDEDELTNLANSILNHPESGSLALPLFNPNISGIENFLSVYKTLTSSVGKCSASTLLALISKIDFSLWLNKNAPNCGDRKVIFNNICDALLVCGYSPSEELLPIFYILKRHFGIIVQYMFPDLFLPSVVFLLKGFEEKKLCTDVCYEAFHCFGCPLFSDKNSVDDISFALRMFASNQKLPADQQIFVSVSRLSLQEVSYVAQLIYSHYMKKHFTGKLYKEYSSYIKPVGILLAMISHSLVALHLNDILSISKPLSISELWDLFHLPFLPWLHPTENSCGLVFPWVNEEELNHVQYMFKIFSASLKYFHEQVLSYENEESVLSCLWNFYVQRYVVPGHRHYSVSLVHSELHNLPWHEFHPCTSDIEGMCKVLQSSLPESKEFLSKISLKIPWSDVMQDISLSKSPEYVARVLATLAKLLIISQLDCVLEKTENNLYPNVFKEFESLSWHFLSINDIEILLDLFYTSVDPIILIKNYNNGKEFHVLQFLKLICCMVPNPDAGEYSNSKRILYLEKFMLTLSACCTSQTAQMLKLLHKLTDIIYSLFDEIKVIISNGVNPNEQTNFALPLVKEILTCLNKLPEGELDKTVLNSVVSWFGLNKKCPLLLPCLKVSSQNLKSVSHMAPLTEICISMRFVDEVLDANETQIVWLLISSYFSVHSSKLNEFVNKCVEQNCYLSLYCCILHRLPHCDSTEKKKALLEQIFRWIKESKLRADSEAKFILIWDKFLELSLKLTFEEEFMVVKQVLTSFCWILEALSEDRSSNGWLGIIGLGQSSTLSVNFRFLCRVMVAFIQYKLPVNGYLSTDMNDLDSNQETSLSASKALDNLKALHQNKLYSALQSQIDYAVKCVTDHKYTLLQSRELLKYFGCVLYPKDSYLSALDILY